MFCPKCGSQIPDGAMFCSICGEKLGQPVAPNAETAPVEAPVVEPVVEAPVETPVFETPVFETPVFETPVVEAPVETPVASEAPVQQPVFQQPVFQQPVYQQPVYQQPAYQQPVAPAVKKKSKAPLIIIIIVAVLLLAAGGLVVFESFFADKEDRPEFLGYFDFNKGDKSNSVMSSSEEKEFKSIVKKMDEAIVEQDGKAYSKLLPSFARDFVWGVYGLDDANDFVEYLYEYEFDENEGKKNKDEKMNGISHIGKNIEVSEEIVAAEEIKPKKLNSAFDDLFDKKFDIESAYLVLNNSCFEGKDGEVTFSDYYIFYLVAGDEDDDEDEGTWYVILVGEDNLDKFDLKPFDDDDDDDDKKKDDKKKKDDDEDEDEE